MTRDGRPFIKHLVLWTCMGNIHGGHELMVYGMAYGVCENKGWSGHGIIIPYGLAYKEWAFCLDAFSITPRFLGMLKYLDRKYLVHVNYSMVLNLNTSM